MNSTMFQLRSFVHHRLYAAAEEILGEVEKTIRIALHEAEVSRSKEKAGSLRKQVDFLHQKSGEQPLSTNSTEASDQCEATLLQEGPGPSRPSEMREESYLSLRPEFPGLPETCTDVDSKDWNYCTTEFKMSQIKEEQEEVTDDSQKPEIVFPFPEIVKIEQDPLATELAYEMHVSASPDCIATQNEVNNSDGMKKTGAQRRMSTRSAPVLQGQSGSDEMTKQTADEDSSAKRQKGRSFCHLCGKNFHYIASLMKHIKAHEGKMDCSICALTFQSTEELHVRFRNKCGLVTCTSSLLIFSYLQNLFYSPD
ncbi:hypothetical protein LDENG_00091960 [Lucifuga dentata]|nr:hypothetical protein LDENG_00091960 [Lucifuga dentata]